MGDVGSMEKLTIHTRHRDDMVDLTRRVAEVVRGSAVERGLCVVFVPHTTAGVTINENADPDVTADIVAALDRIVPWHGPYKHCEGNSAAHVKASMMGSSVTIPIEDGAIQLGTWQGIFLCEYDGPRTRHAWVSLVPAS